MPNHIKLFKYIFTISKFMTSCKILWVCSCHVIICWDESKTTQSEKRGGGLAGVGAAKRASYCCFRPHLSDNRNDWRWPDRWLSRCSSQLEALWRRPPRTTVSPFAPLDRPSGIHTERPFPGCVNTGEKNQSSSAGNPSLDQQLNHFHHFH